MGLPITILVGAGVLIILAALLMKKPSRSDALQGNMITAVERSELEQSLQRFVQQVKRENEAVAVGVHQTRQELIGEVAQLRERLAQTEGQLAVLARQVQSLQAKAILSREERSDEAEDALALRERYRRVFELRQEGLELDEIAKRLGAGRGEIELIVSLAGPQERRGADG
jgi:TolA-binding protein